MGALIWGDILIFRTAYHISATNTNAAIMNHIGILNMIALSVKWTLFPSLRWSRALTLPTTS